MYYYSPSVLKMLIFTCAILIVTMLHNIHIANTTSLPAILHKISPGLKTTNTMMTTDRHRDKRASSLLIKCLLTWWPGITITDDNKQNKLPITNYWQLTGATQVTIQSGPKVYTPFIKPSLLNINWLSTTWQYLKRQLVLLQMKDLLWRLYPFPCRCIDES